MFAEAFFLRERAYGFHFDVKQKKSLLKRIRDRYNLAAELIRSARQQQAEASLRRNLTVEIRLTIQQKLQRFEAVQHQHANMERSKLQRELSRIYLELPPNLELSDELRQKLDTHFTSCSYATGRHRRTDFQIQLLALNMSPPVVDDEFANRIKDKLSGQ